jgi:hypothetical protein
MVEPPAFSYVENAPLGPAKIGNLAIAALAAGRSGSELYTYAHALFEPSGW